MKLALDTLTYRAAFFDPASSKTPLRAARARQAVIVVGTDALHRIFVLDAWAGRLLTERLYAKLLETNEAWHPNVFGVESNCMQSFVGDAVALEAKRQAQRLPLVPVNQPTKIEKDFRIRTILQPVIGWGRLFLRADQHDLRRELLTFPMSPMKDLLDALASAVSLLPVRAPGSRQRDERQALAAYLRQSGMAPRLIAQRLEAYDRRPRTRQTPDLSRT